MQRRSASVQARKTPFGVCFRWRAMHPYVIAQPQVPTKTRSPIKHLVISSPFWDLHTLERLTGHTDTYGLHWTDKLTHGLTANTANADLVKLITVSRVSGLTRTVARTFWFFRSFAFVFVCVRVCVCVCQCGR